MQRKNRNVWSWGLTEGAENWNGRLAMIGLLALVLTEIFTGYNILNFLGFQNTKSLNSSL